MRTVFQILGRVIFVGVACLVGAVIYSTAMGYTTWCFRMNGLVTVDGRATSGYMHTNTQRTVLLLTRTDNEKPETYLVPIAAGKPILDCGHWHPVRFLPNPVGDLNSHCSAADMKSTNAVDAPVNTTLVQAARSVEFSTASGKKVKAVW